MITKRIIPCLDVKNGIVVKGKKFKDIQSVADPVALAKYYSDNGADELVFYDITATSDGRATFFDTVAKVAEAINIPFSVGGGIRTLGDFDLALKAGADKVSINSSAVKDPDLIRRAALKYGNQCVVLSIDIKKVSDGKWEVYTAGGRNASGLDAIEWALKGQALGAGELVLNSIDSDGVKGGYDIELNNTISSLVNIPVIASGGAGKLEDFKDVLTIGKADAALAASVFHFKEIQIKDLKSYLSDNGISIRK
ncbi:MAG: imidazole glycerol phosphate synthase subunit HisF [Acidaminobacteraceae bacterium]